MKATQNQLARLRACFARLKELSPTVYDGYMARGLSENRFGWDCLHAAKGLDGFDDVSTMAYYKAGLNDSHIETLLRKAIGVWK